MIIGDDGGALRQRCRHQGDMGAAHRHLGKIDFSAAQAAGRDMSPSEMVQLTVRCQEFMFHCQLTSNIANRTSDGLQQLFRQQA